MIRGEPLYSPQRVLRGSDINYPGSMNFLYPATVSELEGSYGKMKRGETVNVWGYKVTSITPAVPFDDGAYIPIHYTRKGDEIADDLPGALLRYEGDIKVLIPIDPLGNGKNSKEAIIVVLHRLLTGKCGNRFFTSNWTTPRLRNWNWSVPDTISWPTVKLTWKTLSI